MFGNSGASFIKSTNAKEIGQRSRIPETPSCLNTISLFYCPEHKKSVQSRDNDTLTCFRRNTLHNSIPNIL